MTRTLAGLARRMRCKIARQWQASGRTGAAVRYIAVVLEGVPINAA